MINLGSLTISSGVKSVFNGPGQGIQGLVIGNESGLTCLVTLEGCAIQKTLLPGTVDFFPAAPGFNGNVLVSPSIQIATAILYPSSYLSFDAVGLNEPFNASLYPMALNRPMSAGTSSPQSGFSSALVLSVSASPSNSYGLNLFNPATSTVIARIYSAQIAVSDVPAATPKLCTGNLATRTDGNDNNFGVAVKIFNHNVRDTTLPNGSAMHATAFNDTAISAPNVFLGTWEFGTVPFEFLGPPDSVYLNPGQNFLIDVQNPVASSRVFCMLKWTEA